MSQDWETDVNRDLMALITSRIFPHSNDAEAIRRVCSNIRALIEGIEGGLPQHNKSNNFDESVNNTNVVNIPLKQEFAKEENTKSTELGRNQKSRVRELVIVEFILQSARNLTLHEIKQELNNNGFSPTDSAVGSQLHRLAETDIIERVGSGVYKSTDATGKHYTALRASYGKFLDQHINACGIK